MKHIKTLIITTLTFAICCFNAHAQTVKDFTLQRKLFLEVEADLKKGKINSYRKHKQALQNYPLYPYLRYQLLRLNIDGLKHSELSAFITTYHDSPLADKLRNEWLSAKAKKGLWKDFLLAYDVTGTNDLASQCNYLYARIATNDAAGAFKFVPEIWLNSKSLPKECDPVFSKWKSSGKLSKNLLWQRIKLTIEKGDHKLTKYLAQDLSVSEQKLVDLWLSTHNDPHLIDKTHHFTAKHAAVSEILTHGMRKIAKKNPEEAVKMWKKLEKRHKFKEHHWGEVVKEIGLSLSRRLHVNADKWLNSVPSKMQSTDVNDAKLKVAIHHNAWESIIKTYNTVSIEEQQSDKWRYWYARALEMLGEKDQSQKILYELAQTRTYYGFLASSRILQPYAFHNKKSKVSNELLKTTMQIAPIARAHELLLLGRANTGKTEWARALKVLNEDQRVAAAHLANKWNMPNWSIVALAKAQNKNDLELRFPKTYADHIHRAAEKNKLDPELLFAITRQESAFISTAKSPAGALGLMQIMPKTGKMVATNSKESLRSHNELLQPDKNIRLGSKYVRMMLDKHQQNPALAAASYNAGPHRVTNWLPEYDTPTDCWIETIPFKETREYVQNVLTYTVIYQQLLGKKPRLSKYMPIITGKPRGSK